MKRILITGANSYIGVSFEKYLSQWSQQSSLDSSLDNSNEYVVDTVDMIDGTWREKDFSGYDVVFHVAGIAHADVGKITEEQKALYYKVNTELTIETAAKAKRDGVQQFVFMSSAIVYGDSAPIGKQKVITKDTMPTPANFYGDSKLKAEEGIIGLNDDTFKVVILRPPMIYGKGSKGNYQILSKFAKKLPFFPNIENQRSMLYIENLMEFIRLMIKNEEQGIFFPQNGSYVKTSEMVRMIAEVNGRKIWITRLFNLFVRLVGCFSGMVNKAFGNLTYDMGMSEYKEKYRVKGFKESINDTEE